MLIGKDWQITGEGLNVTVSKRVTREKREGKEKYESWQNVAYFGSVKSALHYLVGQRVRDTALKDLRTVVQAIDKLHKDIDKAVK